MRFLTAPSKAACLAALWLIIGESDATIVKECRWYGFLMPFAVPAIYIETEGDDGAVSRKIVVTQASVQAPQAGVDPRLALQAITVMESSSPELDTPIFKNSSRNRHGKGKCNGTELSFWPHQLTNHETLRWHVKCVEADNTATIVGVPMFFSTNRDGMPTLPCDQRTGSAN